MGPSNCERSRRACSRCTGKTAIYARAYSGEALCKTCFTRSVEENVRRTVGRHRLLRPDDRIGVAISGGKDSTTLLLILAKLEREFPRAQLFGLTIDEGIRGYRAEAVELARRVCKSLGVEHRILSFKGLYGFTLDELVSISREKGRALPCSLCGVLRRKALNVAAREGGATKLATAHNLDDEAQTVLLNLLQGNVLQTLRLGSLEEQPGFVPRVKPLCRIPEREVALYAYLKGVAFQHSPCPYLRGSLRASVRATLNEWEASYPNVKFSIVGFAGRLRSLASPPKASFRACEACGEPATKGLCRACEVLAELGRLRSQ